MTHGIVIHQLGGPEQMRWEPLEVGEVQPDEALVRHRAVGVNFIDTYHRTGLYEMPSLPAVLGVEAAGVVEAVGAAVDGVRPGDRVAYFHSPGCYAEARRVPAEVLVPLTEEIDFEVGAAALVKGMTAAFLVSRTYAVKAGDTVLVHAAAGGVGLLLCQWAAHRGATVIGTVGTPAKAELVQAHGCQHAVVYTREDFVARTAEITGGAGVEVAYDSVGKATFFGSMDCLAPFGTLVAFGQASGPVSPVDILELGSKGSLYLTRPSLAHHVAKRGDLLALASELFAALADGVIEVAVNHRYPLEEAAQAHRDLEARQTTGSIVLIP